jgi:hypothetical protein
MARSLAFCAAIALLYSAPDLRAGAPCCGGCGCQPCTRKVCRLVCETKEVTKKVYSCECEDFCVPGRSICCKTPCNCPGKCCKDHTVWKPTCGCVRTRVVLVAKDEKKKVPSYKCVVEEVCTRCGHCAKATALPAADDAESAVAMAKEAGLEVVADETTALSISPDGQIVPVSANVVSGAGDHRVLTR